MYSCHGVLQNNHGQMQEGLIAVELEAVSFKLW